MPPALTTAHCTTQNPLTVTLNKCGITHGTSWHSSETKTIDDKIEVLPTCRPDPRVKWSTLKHINTTRRVRQELEEGFNATPVWRAHCVVVPGNLSEAGVDASKWVWLRNYILRVISWEEDTAELWERRSDGNLSSIYPTRSLTADLDSGEEWLCMKGDVLLNGIDWVVFKRATKLKSKISILNTNWIL